MRRLFGQRGKRHNKLKSKKTFSRRHISAICLVLIGTAFISLGTFTLLRIFRENEEAQTEYDSIRAVFAFFDEISPERTLISGSPGLGSVNEYSYEAEAIRRYSLDELLALNSDFIGWFSIEDVIEYPIVRGRDNSRYLFTTFLGNRNPAGTIFMDYRHANGFDEKITIVYGHNMRDGTMFAQVALYLEQGFKQSNQYIEITTLDGRTLIYRVFDAVITDAWDMIYTLSVQDPSQAVTMFRNAPSDAQNFLLLSTCTIGGDVDERILVYAALVG